MANTKTLTLHDYAGTAKTIECPIGDGYRYQLNILSGDEVLSVYDKDGSLIDTFDSSNCRCVDFFDGTECFVDFDKLSEYLAERKD